MASVQCNIVSAERHIFAGEIEQLMATGVEGELGILPGHSPLLTELAPGPVYVTRENGEEEIYFVSGGFLEVQPDVISVLADSAERARDLDEAAAQQARDEAQRAVEEKRSDVEYSKALGELAEAAARLKTLSRLRNRRGH